eukprot:TRINITY_DN31821_c0_g1_i1.p1 TRINITY_DN31821_c0_g1~~TRINITY_DN31821_c0_g1_i1.p1  ORF type:complete len:273 (+),score=37.81 TRINITY_DN31821_c0_g1_i1:24-842(+)
MMLHAVMVIGFWVAAVAIVASAELSSSALDLTENCPYWKEPPYSKQWARKNIAAQFQWLHDKFDLHCCPKPNGPVLDLGIVDPAAALEQLKLHSEADWLAEAYRQNTFAVHAETQSLVLLWKGKFQDEIKQLPNWDTWEPLLEPAIRRFVDAKNYKRDEIDIWKAMLARVPGKHKIHVHRDVAPPLAFAHRVHWVLISGQDVKTTIGGKTLSGDYLGPGRLFEFNNVQPHEIVNDGEEARVHVVLDIVPKKMEGLGRISVQTLETGDEKSEL